VTSTGLSRRQTLTGAAALGAAPLLAACGGDDSGDVATEAPPAGETLGPSADVPVGGGTIYADQKVVVTQPTEGEFKGFSSICPHQRCPVTAVADGTINCTCHGSKFSVEDGTVVNGPATSGLSPVSVSVDGDQLTTS
jgi:nitrite reductase/ring-hydroxylating ferredoxin subunit